MAAESATPYDRTSGRWSMVAQSLSRPYRVSFPMVLLVSLVPLYILIPELFPPLTRHAPSLPLDTALPLFPSWALVYGALYLFLILLPIFVVRQEEQIRRTVYAYLLIWIVAYALFVIYPTAAPRPAKVVGEGFAVWGITRALFGRSAVQLLPFASCCAFVRFSADVRTCPSAAWTVRRDLCSLGRSIDLVHQTALHRRRPCRHPSGAHCLCVVSAPRFSRTHSGVRP